MGGEAVNRIFAAPWASALIGLPLVINAFGAFGDQGAAVSRMPFAAGRRPAITGSLRTHPFPLEHSSCCISDAGPGGFRTVDLFPAWRHDASGLSGNRIADIHRGFLPCIYIVMSAWKAKHNMAATAGLGVTLFWLLCSIIPAPEVKNVWLFEGKLALGTAAMIGSGLLLYARGRARSRVLGPEDLKPGLLRSMAD